MCPIEHILERRVVVVRVRSRGRVGEGRRRVQKLVEVMGLGLITCGEGEDVSSVHTLLSGVVQVFHELLVELRLLLLHEEDEKEEEQGRQGEKEVERGGQSEETALMDDCVDGCESARLKLEPNVSMDEMCKRG